MILDDWLHALPVMGQEFLLAFMTPATLRVLLSVNKNEVRDVTLLVLSHLVHSFFHLKTSCVIKLASGRVKYVKN